MRFPAKEGLLVALSASGVRAVNNGLARTPQMGWNNWNTFACSVSSTLLTNTAKLLTEYGLQDLGYKYVVLDDCWSSGRDANGKLVADTTKFPDGMGAVADELHEQGFLFGMYSSAGEMTCARYAHFSMWAALKSPLLLGNDLRKLTASSLAIINNPAIIALNQDPRGRAIQRISRDLDVPKDRHGVGETHVWSGPLANGDQVVILLNAADTDLDMSVSLEDIFIMDGVGTAPQVKQDWAIHDLWGSGSRMSSHDAQALLDAKDADARKSLLQTKLDWYNATELPYAQGLSRRDPRLFGERVGAVQAGGSINARVPRHAAKVFRLQSTSGEDTTRKSLLKDEL